MDISVYRIKFGIGGRDSVLVVASSYAQAENKFKAWINEHRGFTDAIIAMEALEEQLVGGTET